MATTYEVRFQTVDPDRRVEYVKMYKQAIQEIKLAASHALSRRGRRLAKPAKYGRILPRRDDLKIAEVR